MSNTDWNTGHGHVHPRPDGAKARCGGPGICAACSREAALMPKREGLELIGTSGKAVIAMCEFHGRIFVACEDGVWVKQDDGTFKELKFVDADADPNLK